MKGIFKNLLHVNRLFCLAALSVLLGRAYQHLFWDAPFRALLWDERWLRPLIESLGWVWSDWVTSPAVDANIQRAITGMGIFYLLAALSIIWACLPAHARFTKWARKLLPFFMWSSAFLLFLLALMYWKEKFFHLGQLFEFSLQAISPLLFLLSQNAGASAVRRRLGWIKLAIALTFVCHGLYALGIYPRPGDFVTMMMQGLWLSEDQAMKMLYLAGVLDFVAALALFLPGRVGKVALWYCILWGLLTALARVWAHFYLPFWSESLHQWAWQTVVRLPHFFVPLAVWAVLSRQCSVGSYTL